MRSLSTMAGSALIAAVLAGPSAASEPSVGVAPSWTGAYVGGSLNFGRGSNEAAEVNGARDYMTDFGAAYGAGHIGWQRQWARLVGGIELEAGYLGMGSTVTRDVTGGSITSGTDIGAYGALSGRMGVLLTPTLLLYGRAGVALADINGKTTQTCDAGLCGGAQSTTVSEAKTKSPSWGLLVGAGLEHQFSSHWSGRIEYKYMDFRKELALPAVDGPGWNHGVDVHSLSLGISYRF